MGATLDMERIAKALGAQRRGKVAARGGYFGALQLSCDVAARFRVPGGGGDAAARSRSEQRLVRLSPATLAQLQKLAEQAHASPMQVAALLLEQAVRAVVSRDQPDRTGG